MNALFAKVQADPQLKDKLKFIGTGQGNEEPQLKMWQGFQKRKVVREITNAVVKSLDVPPDAVRIILQEMSKENYAIAGTLKFDE